MNKKQTIAFLRQRMRNAITELTDEEVEFAFFELDGDSDHSSRIDLWAMLMFDGIRREMKRDGISATLRKYRRERDGEEDAP